MIETKIDGRGRPSKLNDEMKREITRYVLKNKKRVPVSAALALLRSHLEGKVRKEMAQAGWAPDQISDKVHSILPGNSITLKFMNQLYRNCDLLQLDAPWQLAALIKNPIPMEALPYILIVQDWAEKYPDDAGQPHFPVTIRQALWIGRLCSIINLEQIKANPPILRSAGRFLYLWSYAYSDYEKICAFSETPFDTSHLDKALRRLAEPMALDAMLLINPPPDTQFR